MNEQGFNNFKQEKIRQVSELRTRWNDKFLSDLKENRNNRILFMQNMSVITIGLIGAGIFFEKVEGIYANTSFIFGLVTVSFVILYLRESLDNESNGNHDLLREQNKLFHEYERGLRELESYEKYDELVTHLNEKIDKPKNFLFDCSGEIINFLFISTLMFLGLSLFDISFRNCYVVGTILISFILAFLPTYYIITWPISCIVTKIKK